MDPMRNGEKRRNAPEVTTGPRHRSAVMVGSGTLIALTGLAVGLQHVLSSTRRWVNEMEVPPREPARLKWTQARAAMAAGTSAWQNGAQSDPSRPSPAI